MFIKACCQERKIYLGRTERAKKGGESWASIKGHRVNEWPARNTTCVM